MVNRKQQRGVVLVVSLVFLIALIGVAAALMQNTTTDIRMSGASEEKVTSVQEAISSTDEIIYKQKRKIDGINLFTSNVNTFPHKDKVTLTAENTTSVLSVVNANNLNTNLESSCPHTRSASSIQVFTCNVLNIKVTRKYGRDKNHEINVNTGIAQQLLNVGG